MSSENETQIEADFRTKALVKMIFDVVNDTHLGYCSVFVLFITLS